MSSRSIFYGSGGWVGVQTGLTTCSFWANDPADPSVAWSPNLLIPVDLSKNPQGVRDKSIKADEIQVDDKPANGGLTKIGPVWPIGSTINGVWLESNFWGSLGAKQPPRVPAYMDCRDYELTTVLYWNTPLANRRFWGFHAEITAETGSTATVSIYPAGKSLAPGVQPAGSWPLDLAMVAHPIEPGFTTIGVGANPKSGALFLDAPTVSALALSGPKVPKSLGAVLYPTARGR
jgi:hypothetical protein